MVSAGAQVGVLTACVVQFVPMGLAGWHLSRNKVLFFSGALFVSLVVGVHLFPYLPSLPHLLLSSFHPAVPSSSSASSCVLFLHRVSWADAAEAKGGGGGKRVWAWPPSLAATCGFVRLSWDDALLLLNGSWVVVAGDSQARLLVLVLLRLLLDLAAVAVAEPELFRRHSDYHARVPAQGISVDFVWAPFEGNLTQLLHEDLFLAPRCPRRARSCASRARTVGGWGRASLRARLGGERRPQVYGREGQFGGRDGEGEGNVGRACS